MTDTTPGALAPGVAVASGAAASGAGASPGSPPPPGQAGPPDRAAALPQPQVPGRLTRAWEWLFRERSWLFDGMLAVLIFIPAVLALSFDRPGEITVVPAWAYAVAAITCGALVFRRRAPRTVVVITSVGYLILQVLSPDVPPVIAALVTAMATATLSGARRFSIVAASVTTVAALIIGTSGDREFWMHPRPLAIAATCALAIALADGIRNRRAYLAAVEERARRAEASRDLEARRRVDEERLRIARDLHDVLAHHIAVIGVQAGVAGQLLEQRPAQAREALGHVRDAAQSVLSEMQAVLTVLREPGDSLEPAEPAPGLRQLEQLTAQFRETGLVIDVETVGVPRPLPAAVDLVAYRAVQEALTNVRKHAGVAALVRLEYSGTELIVAVTNGPAHRAAPGGGAGFGLIGMRERAQSVGGSMQAGPTQDGGYRAAVRLPLPA